MRTIFCDICDDELTASSTGAIAGGALTELTGSEHVCARCAAVAADIDWKNEVRRLWREVRGIGG